MGELQGELMAALPGEQKNWLLWETDIAQV